MRRPVIVVLVVVVFSLQTVSHGREWTRFHMGTLQLMTSYSTLMKWKGCERGAKTVPSYFGERALGINQRDFLLYVHVSFQWNNFSRK